MDQLGIWEPVDKSEWVHPLVTVPKKDGSVRITTDLTKLNEYVIPDRFPIPRIKDLILNMVGSRVFSKIDLKKGYFHIPLHKDSRHLTTTITPLGLRQYLRLPMGLKDSASAFQKRVQQTLINLEGVEVYVDDIIIHGRTQGEHDQRLYAALKVLNDNDFRLAQEEKLHFSAGMIPAFGFIISAEGVKPDPANVQPILEADPPKTIKQLQRFLGMINYFLEFLKDSAPITEPLRKLTRKDQRFEWGPEQELAFKTLKAMIAEKTQLQIFNPEAKTFLTTDASDVGTGVVLSQKASANDLEVPVAFYNMTLDSAQRNYAANEKEALACVRACEHFEHFLLGRHFTLRTDHQALKTILSSPKSTRQSSKFLRWKQRLDEFDFTVEYLPGPANQVADYLSRLKDRAQQLKVQAASGEITTVTAEQIIEATKQDDELRVDGLKRLLYSYRMTPTRGGKSPADLFFGRTVRPDWKPNTTKPWRLTRRQQTGEPEQAPQAQPFTGFSRYRMGHKVLVRIPWVPKGQSPWKGPLTVKRPLGTYTYLLDDNQTWHERNLKPWTTPIQRAEYLDDTPAPQVPPRQEQPLRRSKRIRRPPKRYNFE